VRDNRRRILAEALSIDAWHEPIKLNGTTSAVHVELSFHEGRLGGETEDFPFTFKVTLKKALLTIRVEKPLEIDKRSIARSVPEAQVELTRLRKARDTAQSQSGAAAGISPKAFALALRAESTSASEVAAEDELKVIQALPRTIVTPRPDGPRQYSWELEPTYQSALRGQPWDPVQAPRLRVKHIGARSALDPCINVEVRCALEDVHISDLQPKAFGIRETMKDAVFNRINEAAAIQHLKLVLREADLEPSRMDNRFSDILLASVLALPE
jgi:hypothetical protein